MVEIRHASAEGGVEYQIAQWCDVLLSGRRAPSVNMETIDSTGVARPR